jgi:hypothetical protein
MRWVLWAVMAGAMIATCVAQDLPNNVHQFTTPPPNARFEIVQSELTVKWTYLLDRFTGEVYQLVVKGDGSLAWDSMIVDPIPQFNAKQPHPRFQIFTSGLAAKNTFLLDTYSGFTWTVTNTGVWRSLSEVKTK